MMQNGSPSFAQLTAAQPPEIIDAALDVKNIAAFLGIQPQDIDVQNFAITYVSVGLPFLFVPLTGLSVAGRIKIDIQKMESTLHHAQTKDVYVFTKECKQPDSQFHVRMFAPLQGIPEDPATGSAAAAFAGYLAMKDSALSGSFAWKVEQGVEMGRPSLLYLEADKKNGDISAIRVGGNSMLVCEGEMEI